MLGAYHIEPCLIIAAVRVISADDGDGIEEDIWGKCVLPDSMEKLVFQQQTGGRSNPFGYSPTNPAFNVICCILLWGLSGAMFFTAIRWSCCWQRAARNVASSVAREERIKSTMSSLLMVQHPGEREAEPPLSLLRRLASYSTWWDVNISDVDAKWGAYRDLLMEVVEISVQLLLVSRGFAESGYYGAALAHMTVVALNVLLSLPLLTSTKIRTRVTVASFIDIACDTIYTILPFVVGFYYLINTADVSTCPDLLNECLDGEEVDDVLILHILQTSMLQIALWSANTPDFLTSLLTVCLPGMLVTERFGKLFRYVMAESVWDELAQGVSAVYVWVS